ncbi:7-keto-8-aminopelargonate synthetase-like enzyme [Arcticibacter tournemirensis]|uniref:Pyridoxal phosphate-dependent aminotransferase family protein n=1 Tax=Arcticibacter tournemirensis TaxID=699437 RepID=A0A5M9HFT6_9SPHI|nr:aminotransferase class I/II-fold pyridoxal phosphate-dependent enzyme [Arcticibacter tournemirensis]KAA8485856.1 pyridoxal phosphate-dependent aminotransferase family protein [Arcticibacter tournemirensis]TQM46895.1 7-keto-8-aminopelargonate synthetase-like enzyme [Arcticibacter tournemirensis]
MHYLERTPGRTALSGGKEYLFFSGYNYLGINAVPGFARLLQEGICKYGWLCSSARVSNTRFNIYEECEALLSDITGSEDTVLFPSGFSAGRAAIQVNDGEFFNAPGSHPAILKNKALQTDYNEWCRWFLSKINDDGNYGIAGFAGDSVNPLRAVVNDFSFLEEVQKEVTGIIDDSHGIGLIGDKGSGIHALLPAGALLEYIFTYSLSKAFGILGGAVSCSKEIAGRLRALPDYAAVTATLPAQMYAFVNGQEIYSEQREKLARNITYFSLCIKDIQGIQYHPELPMFILPEDMDEELLAGYGIIISSFAYPDPSGKKIKRLVLNALHTPRDLEYVAECLHLILSKG